MSQSKMCFYSYIFEQQVVLQKQIQTDTVTKINIFLTFFTLMQWSYLLLRCNLILNYIKSDVGLWKL